MHPSCCQVPLGLGTSAGEAAENGLATPQQRPHKACIRGGTLSLLAKKARGSSESVWERRRFVRWPTDTGVRSGGRGTLTTGAGHPSLPGSHPLAL